jgi:hypothetical protein
MVLGQFSLYPLYLKLLQKQRIMLRISAFFDVTEKAIGRDICFFWIEQLQTL